MAGDDSAAAPARAFARRLISSWHCSPAVSPAKGRGTPRPHQELSVTSLPTPDTFVPRHIGPSEADQRAMLAALGYPSLAALIDATVPANIRLKSPLALPPAMSEQEALAAFRALVAPHEVWRSFIGLGYSPPHTPAGIRRNILANPGWSTPSTPTQAQIAQGRLPALAHDQ